MVETDLTRDHRPIADDSAARRYFADFGRIAGLMPGVAAEMVRDRRLEDADAGIIGAHVTAIAATFRALALKYLMAGRVGGVAARHLVFDTQDSGFPVHQELLTMASDAQNARRHLEQTPPAATLRDEMIRQIVGAQTVPVQLQYAMSQRLYYQALEEGGLFWAQNHPQAIWQEDMPGGRRRYLLHWAVYDSQLNLPVLYLMDVQDSGRTALPRDQARWPRVQAHLLAQAVGGLKLVTIGRGFDADFDDLHPKRLRRLHLGPVHSQVFTTQTGPIRAVLEQAMAGEGEDWAMVWTLETLESERVEREKSGWFSEVEREVFRLDPYSGRGVDTGATRTERSLILPERPYQALAELNPEAFRQVRKYVVARSGRIIVQA